MKNMGKPIIRNQGLQPLSRDHHHALLLCWKIRAGFEKGIPAERIKTYTDWFYKNNIIDHFTMEEEYLYPVLGSEDKLIQQAMEDHKNLANLFTDESKIEESLKQIPDELNKHIRFEERTLFNEIQTAASPAQLEKFELIHDKGKFVDNLYDEFWLNKVNRIYP